MTALALPTVNLRCATVRLATILAMLLLVALVAAPSSMAKTGHGAHTAQRTIPSSWTARTNHAFQAKVKGKNVYQYLRYRAHRHKAGETLAVVLGVDHVASYDGPRVNATYRFYKMAERLGYEVYFVTGSPLPRARNLLTGAGFNQYERIARCSSNGGSEAQARCKGQYRTGLVQDGLTLVVNVAAHVPGWKYGKQAERTIKLTY